MPAVGVIDVEQPDPLFSAVSFGVRSGAGVHSGEGVSIGAGVSVGWGGSTRVTVPRV